MTQKIDRPYSEDRIADPDGIINLDDEICLMGGEPGEPAFDEMITEKGEPSDRFQIDDEDLNEWFRDDEDAEEDDEFEFEVEFSDE